MARKRFTDEQIVLILREAERASSKKEVIRKHGISEQTLYRWQRRFGGMEASQVRRIKELEEENRRLKQLAGEQALVIETLKEFQKKRGWA